MQLLDQLKQAAEAKRRESIEVAQGYGASLTVLWPANFILVVGAALLSLVAGATILIENNLLTPKQSGVLALISGALTIIHSRLGCEQYQAECRKLVSFHRGMAQDYENLGIVADEDEFRKRLSGLNDQLSAMVKSTTARPLRFPFTKRATK